MTAVKVADIFALQIEVAPQVFDAIIENHCSVSLHIKVSIVWILVGVVTRISRVEGASRATRVSRVERMS